MESDASYFIDLAYRLFPKGISDEDEQRYFQTREYRYLLQRIEEAKHLEQKWQFLYSSLKTEFALQEIGRPDRVDRTFRIAIINAY